MVTKNHEWKILRRKIKKRFGKLSNVDIESLHGHMGQLANKIKMAYDYDKSKAEQECKSFYDSIKH